MPITRLALDFLPEPEFEIATSVNALDEGDASFHSTLLRVISAAPIRHDF